MNNTNIRNLAIFAVGALLGSAVTYKLLKTKYEQIAQEEIDDVREYAKKQIDYYDAFYRNEIEKLEEKEAENTLDLDDLKWEHDEARRIGDMKQLTKRYGMEEKKDLNTVLRERGLLPIPDESRLTPKADLYPEDDEPEEEDEFESTPIEEMDTEKENIFMIPQDDFMESNENFEVISLTYYAEDGILTDERDEPVPDPENILGPNPFAAFGTDELEDPNVIYIRNERMSTDFEIIRNMASYVETVLGYETAPQEKVIHHKVVEPKPKAKAKPRAKKLNNDGVI